MHLYTRNKNYFYNVIQIRDLDFGEQAKATSILKARFWLFVVNTTHGYGNQWTDAYKLGIMPDKIKLLDVKNRVIKLFTKLHNLKQENSLLGLI